MDPSHPNVYAPESVRLPLFLLIMQNGLPLMSFGQWGSMQPQGHVQILINMFDYG